MTQERYAMRLTFSGREVTPGGPIQRVNGGRTGSGCNVAPPTLGTPCARNVRPGVITPTPRTRSRSRRCGFWSAGAEHRGGGGRRTGAGTGSAASPSVVCRRCATLWGMTDPTPPEADGGPPETDADRSHYDRNDWND